MSLNLYFNHIMKKNCVVTCNMIWYFIETAFAIMGNFLITPLTPLTIIIHHLRDYWLNPITLEIVLFYILIIKKNASYSALNQRKRVNLNILLKILNIITTLNIIFNVSQSVFFYHVYNFFGHCLLYWLYETFR